MEQLCTSSNWVNFALEQISQNGKIGTFKYSTCGTHLLSAILFRTSGKNAREFANEFLFSQIGMKEIPEYPMTNYGYEDLFGQKVKGWVHDPHNITTGGWGLTLTVRDMARFGLLYLNNGLWNDKEVVPHNWVVDSIKPNKNHYGYMWWLFKDKNISAFAAIGDGGNIICCIPQKNTVVAIASQFIPNPKDRWILIKEHILPAII